MFENLRTCVAPDGRFVCGVHRPRYAVKNMRQATITGSLGTFDDGEPKRNEPNFPAGDVKEPDGGWIYEIPNAFPFRGTTYILKSWADARASERAAFKLDHQPPLSFSELIRSHWLPADADPDQVSEIFRDLPNALKLALAVNSSDPSDLIRLADLSCRFVRDHNGGRPIGLAHLRDSGGGKAVITDPLLFEAVANNPALPDAYKHAMVLKPGIQGDSEIVGEWRVKDSHVFEYLRRNSYIPWGHFAANMADDAVRYRLGELTCDDIRGMRHLYYQRTFVRLAEALQMEVPATRRPLTEAELESLRLQIVDALQTDAQIARLPFKSTLWGWNFGFDFSPSGYRLHASHQQIHSQYALIPKLVSPQAAPDSQALSLPAFGCGDLVADFIRQYRQVTGRSFFPALITALRNNRRLDRSAGNAQSLVIYEDDQVMLFVPKAQTSQWELQLMTLKPIGHILEADEPTRRSLDRVMLAAMQTLETLGARMITAFEFAKPFDSAESDQRLLYVFLPRLPQSPGAFSEAQLRWICGHYPEDFADACRTRLPSVCNGDADRPFRQ